MLILLFMAVTSSTSAELIAVSSLLTFDVYKNYISPNATSHRLVQISHYGIILYGIVLAAFCCMLNAVGCNLTWILTVLGVIVGGASLPVGLVLLWPRMSTVATQVAPWTALALGLVAWFLTTSQLSGTITVETSGAVTNAVAGNLVSWGSGGILSLLLTLFFPGKYESKDTAHRDRAAKIQGVIPASPAESSDHDVNAHVDEEKATHHADAITRKAHTDVESPSPSPSTQDQATGNALVDYLSTSHIVPLDPNLAKQSSIWGWSANITFGLIAIILVPFALFGTGYLFSLEFFTGWIVVSFIWVWVSFGICVISPLVESRREMAEVAGGLWRDVRAMSQRTASQN